MVQKEYILHYLHTHPNQLWIHKKGRLDNDLPATEEYLDYLGQVYLERPTNENSRNYVEVYNHFRFLRREYKTHLENLLRIKSI